MSDDPFDALRPTDAEVEAVRQPLPHRLRRQAADWTAPTSDEVARLQARRPKQLPSPAPRAWPPLLLAAVALLSLRLVALPTPAAPLPPPPITAEATLAVPHGPLNLNEDILAEGDGALTVQSHSADGARVSVTDGAVTFTVDPTGRGRDLRVQAGPVEVRVTGTKFTVRRDAATEAVQVSVTRGSVAITAPDVSTAISAGEQWSWQPPEPDAAIAVVVQEPRPVAPQPPEQSAERSTELFVSIMNAEASGAAPGRLLSMTETFLRVYPDSPFREEVDVLRLESLAKTDPGAARGPLAAWLAAHPGSSRRGAMLLLAGGLAEQDSGCDEALPYYRELATAGDPHQQAQARARVADCMEP